MAQPTGTYSTYQGKGIRENLADVIYNISPIDTPFMNNIGRETASNTYYEWQTDALNAPDTANAAIEGGDAPTASASPTTRLGNYTQISTKNVTVSGTGDGKTGGRETPGNDVAHHRPPRMPDMQGTRRVGADELHHHVTVPSQIHRAVPLS